MKNAPAKNVDEFIAGYPPKVQKSLQRLREFIKKAVPDAKEKIAYGIPTFTLNDTNLVHFSAYSHHIGFYPGSAPIKEFAKQLEDYETSKGTVRFPIDKPLPLALVRRLILAAVEHNLTRSAGA